MIFSRWTRLGQQFSNQINRLSFNNATVGVPPTEENARVSLFETLLHIGSERQKENAGQLYRSRSLRV